jgi:hypothetical protein
MIEITMDDFRKKAIDTFLTNVKTKLPSTTEHTLQVMELAFSAGFNVGKANDKNELTKNIALRMLAL